MKKLLVTLSALIAIVVMSGCNLPGSSPSSSHACADKVVQSMVTNSKVSGLWVCLDSAFQSKLKSFVAVGLAISADDAVFTDGTSNKPPVLSTQYVGTANGVDLYTAVVKRSDGTLVTITITVWVDGSGKVDNVAVSGPTF